MMLLLLIAWLSDLSQEPDLLFSGKLPAGHGEVLRVAEGLSRGITETQREAVALGGRV